jgi:hypothetical protein
MMTPAEHRAALHGLCIAPQQYRKISNQADNRMRTRTAKQQLADALAASAAERKPPDLPAPDDGDNASTQRQVLR